MSATLSRLSNGWKTFSHEKAQKAQNGLSGIPKARSEYLRSEHWKNGGLIFQTLELADQLDSSSVDLSSMKRASCTA
jgi:hypothetical protein